ncbi:heparinase II/III family protein [Formosa sp. PL04]|uniref:heparinase II/III domain-containing protein n=1 Tax=Formosa sp. PL04 TaxID=3081755 RepID=UPI002981832A|nr:heparinase II/III family protein [Formosa sp. PL04]MDW5290776.1 heparinase II/III family protein [Formosa sp. PL04]
MKNKVLKIKPFALFMLLGTLMCSTISSAQNTSHPRIYISEGSRTAFLEDTKNVAWKQDLIDKKAEGLEKYLELCENDPTWLVSRLQMNWKTKHNKVYLKGGDFDYSEGTAPVATVRFSGTRDWATDYISPRLEDIEPYFDDPRGYYLQHKENGIKEWVHPSKMGHAIEEINRSIMDLVADAAFLYWVTGDEKYAEFATPVYKTYIEGMYYRDAPIDLTNSDQQRLSGLATFEVIHEKILIHLITTYDFLFNYFEANNVDLDHSTKVFQKWGDQIVKNGVPDNNWNLFQARFLMYVAMVLDSDSSYKNGKGREYFLDLIFKTSTDRQLSINESLLVYDQDTGVWPESASYSIHVITTLLKIVTLLDQSTNNNELAQFPIIEKAALASFQYLFPSGYSIGFGDSNHKTLPPENFELLIATYRKYNDSKKEVVISGLLEQMIAKGEYERKATDLFELFFYVDHLKPEKTTEKELQQLTSPTFYAPNVSLFNQRLGIGEDAMMVSTFGSFGNHAHANGVAIELYAKGYVLGPDMGKGSSYWHENHNEYYSKFPAHNTVVVDGISDYEAMRSYHPFTLDQAFPKSGEEPTFNGLTYSKVSFFEPKAKADQQRFTALIKSKSNAGYIVDVFRSKTEKDGKQRHDYFYHNLGQSLQLFDVNSQLLNLTTTDEFGSKYGDVKGYDYITNKKKIATTKDVQALYRLKSADEPDNLMKLWIKGSENQNIYTALAPKSNVISKGTAPEAVLNDSIQTLIVQRNAAAWDNPFAVVFNPYMEGQENPISKVTYSKLKDNPSTQVIDVLLADTKTTDKIVLNTSERAIVEQDDFYQQGVLSVARLGNNSTDLEYFFISGVYKYKQFGWEIIASGEAVSVSVERSGNTFTIESSGPILIRAPFVDGKKEAELRIFDNGKIITKRQGQLGRKNPDQLEFILGKAQPKVQIVF